MKRIFCFLLLASLLIIPVSAHSGGTDSDGGHYDSVTGEYHYHHGYPAHSHPGGKCPYKNGFQSSGSSSNGSDDVTVFDVLGTIFLSILIFPFVYWIFGSIRDKIKSEKNLLPNTEEKIDETPKPNPPEKQQEPILPKEPQKNPEIPPPPYEPSQPRSPSSAKEYHPAPRAEISEKSSSASPAILINSLYFDKPTAAAFQLSMATDRATRALLEKIEITDMVKITDSTPFRVYCIAKSASGNAYTTSLTDCTCPDRRKRHVVCKHMIALAIEVGAVRIPLNNITD